jgi:FKBP-type peptidyl-prolyl cis-trans isomerase 2
MKKNEIVGLKIKSTTNGELIEEVEKQVPVGRGYLHKALDASILKHKVGDKYKLELSVKQAYGSRQGELIKMIPARHFKQSNIKPVKGLIVNVDGILGKVVSTGSGRVMVDFNHPLAGKPVTFEIKILKKISKPEEAVNVVIQSMLGQKLSVNKNKENIVVNDSIGLPESIKERIDSEIAAVLGKKIAASIKYISKKQG